MNLKREEVALVDYENAVRENPKAPFVYSSLGNYYRTIGNYEKALENFLKASELEPDNVSFLYCVGNCYDIIGDKEKSNQYYTKSYVVDPEYDMPYYNKALSISKEMESEENVNKKQTLRTEALTYYQTCLSKNPLNVEAMNNIGYLLRDINPKEALTYLNQAWATSLSDTYINILCNRGIAYFDSKEYVFALRDLEFTLLYNPSDVRILSTISRCYSFLGPMAKAYYYANFAIAMYNQVKKGDAGQAFETMNYLCQIGAVVKDGNDYKWTYKYEGVER